MFRWIKKIYHPPVFQGSLKKKNYFEGWYYKYVTSDGQRFAFIPGISLNDNDSHSFIQFIHGDTGATEYFRFPAEEFHFQRDKLWVKIQDNIFTDDLMEVNLQGKEFRAQGKVTFGELKKLPATLFSPGIMGWYSFMPFMECYHGLVSIDHSVNGSLSFGWGDVDLAGGRGYIEKDWGTSFPRSWIWMQSNHFQREGISFMFSVAKIPWLRSEFDGFLCVLLYNDKIYRFATYTGARVTALEVKGTKIKATVKDSKYRLEINMEKDKAGSLAAPVMGEMKRMIHESMNSKVHIEFYNDGELIYAGTGHHAGCEIVGDEPWFY